MSRCVNDVNNVRLLLGMGLLNIVQTPILYALAITVMLVVDWRLGLLVILPYPLFALFARVFARRMHAASLAAQEQLGSLSSTVQENVSGVFVVRSYTMEERECERFENDNQELYRRQIRLARIQSGMHGTIAVLPGIVPLIVLLAGAPRVASGSLAQADLWLFFAYAAQLTFPTFMVGWVINVVQRARAGLDRLSHILDVVPSIRDREDVVDMERIEGEVDIRELGVVYPSRQERPALEGVSVHVVRGQTVGVVGQVGAGTTTLLNAIPRILEVPDGAVRIDGIDVNRVPLGLLRRSIAMVPQDSFLFSATIADNIRFGAPDATLDQVREAARRAHVLGDIEEFRHGFDTMVGERGITLSGGQRQRIALARALLLEPSILILDDALSSVDSATEEGILKELRAAKEGRTCFIVAHRLSSLRDADFILVLDEGKVAETGTHSGLLKTDGIYARIHRQQQLEAELDGDL